MSGKQSETSTNLIYNKKKQNKFNLKNLEITISSFTFKKVSSKKYLRNTMLYQIDTLYL